MATLAGVFYFDGRPTDTDRRWLAASLQPTAPDGVSIVASDGVVMGYGACHVWRRDAAAAQPVRSESGSVLTWDGRLDNRDDVLLRLGGCLVDEVSDAELALSVFERWGIDGLACLVGDWSAAIWNGSQRTLYLARDYMGVRPLYYYVDHDAVMWSSSLGELAIRSGRVDDLDAAFVAGFMTLRMSTEVTPYAGTRAVPTATCLSFEPAGGPRRRQFWNFEPGLVRYRQASQYEEHLRSLWIDAVSARLDVTGTVWAELSGGLDSSSVVCMADALIKARRVSAEALQPLSHVTMQSPEGDERRFIAEVEARIGVSSHVIGIEEHQELRNHSWDWVTPCGPQGVQIASLEHVRQGGGRLILSGRMGDLVMGCAPDNSVAVFDDLADGRIPTAVGKIRHWSRARRVPFAEIARELAAEVIGAAARRPHTFAPSGTQIAGHNLLAAPLRTLAEEASPWEGHQPRARLAQRELHGLILHMSRQAQLEVQAEASGVTYSYPFAHRPLVDFMLSVPGEQLSAPGELRSLMRRSFAALVPARVLQRISKGYYPPAVLRATRQVAASMLPVDRTRIVARGWMSAARLDAAVRALVDGASGAGSEVQRAVRLEEWLIARDRWGPTATPQGKEVNTNEVLIA